MKLLQMHIEFLLPDDFDGDWATALHELARYHDESVKAKRTKINSSDIHAPTPDMTCWDAEKLMIKEVLRINKEDGRRFVGGVAVAEYKDGDWVKYPLIGQKVGSD